MEKQRQKELGELGKDYELLGELAGRNDARTFIGKRRSDGLGVLITVAHAPEDDRGSALNHLAADTNLLATLEHPNLLRVLEGHWLATDAFAVVTERTSAPALESLLDREKPSFERIATILRHVNELLDWARQQRVVHRTITPHTLFVDEGSDRVLASFALRPLSLHAMPGVHDDATTVATLATAMFGDRELPSRVRDETEALLRATRDSSAEPDIAGYVATVAMADALKRGESEYVLASNEMLEQQRAAQVQLETERREHEQQIAEEKEAFAKEREEFQRALEKEREELQGAVAREREQLADEREELHRSVASERDDLRQMLEKETEELQRSTAKDRKELEREIAGQRSAIERERRALAKERAAFERSREKSRQQIAAKLASLEAHAQLYRPTEELPALEAEEPAFADDISVAQDATADREYVENGSETGWWKRAWGNRTWRGIGAGGAAVLLIVALSVFAGSRQREPETTAAGVRPVPAPAPVPESAAGEVYLSAPPPPPATMEEWEAPVQRATAASRPRGDLSSRRSEPVADSAAVESPGATTMAQRDTTTPLDSTPAVAPALSPRGTTTGTTTGTTRTLDSIVNVERDSLPKVDLLPKRDTTPANPQRGRT